MLDNNRNNKLGLHQFSKSNIKHIEIEIDLNVTLCILVFFTEIRLVNHLAAKYHSRLLFNDISIISLQNLI